jgi:hypothetical protein
MNLLTLTEAAVIAKRETSSLRRAIQRGDLKATKKGKTWLVLPKELQRWIDDPTMHIRGKPPKTEGSAT